MGRIVEESVEERGNIVGLKREASGLRRRRRLLWRRWRGAGRGIEQIRHWKRGNGGEKEIRQGTTTYRGVGVGLEKEED